MLAHEGVECDIRKLINYLKGFRLFMFSRVIPSWEDIEQLKQPLTKGERYLLQFLDENLKKDASFQGNDLTQYNGWLIFVQPFLNGTRPDIIIFNPRVGVQIFEVKDWNLCNYSFKNREDFCVSDGHGTYTIKSPVKQVEYYKEKIAGQLVPQIGERFDEDISSYGLIKTAVYFHKSTTAQAQELFKGQVKSFSTFPIIGQDALVKTGLTDVIPDHYRNASIYWQKCWNTELLFWLIPPLHVAEQSNPLTISGDQKKFAEPQPGHYRVRGIAGSGKTHVLAYRASKLASQGYSVLVLTYNLTLGHVIRDMVQRSPFNFSWVNLTIKYFHGFCKDILNEFGETWPEGNGEDLFKEIIVNKVLGVIGKNEYDKYDAILIDEGQDFYIEWYSMLCQFLTSRDEVVVVCDKKQNIYERETAWLDKRRRGVEKFGNWIDLKKVIRLPEKIAKISVAFSERFKFEQDLKVVIEGPNIFNPFEDHVAWWNVGIDWLDKVDEAFEVIKNQATHKHPSDTVILLPDRKYGIKCVKFFENKNILVNHVFEDDNERKYHRHKKAFWMGDGRLKISTIHSFKGWETPNVIVVIPSLDYVQAILPAKEQIYDSIVYTAITRAKENLIVINMNSRYWEFGEAVSEKW